MQPQPFNFTQQNETYTFPHLANCQFGLSWDFFGGKAVDLDASILMLDDFGSMVDAVYYNKTVSDFGSIVHSGDNRDGTGDGDDECITVNFPLVPATIKFLIVVVTCYNDGTFADVETAQLHFRDNNVPIGNIALGCTGPHKGYVYTYLVRNMDNTWSLKTVGCLLRVKILPLV